MFYGNVTLRSLKHTQGILKEDDVQIIDIVLHLLFVVVCVPEEAVCASVYDKVWEQLARVASLYPPSGS